MTIDFPPTQTISTHSLEAIGVELLGAGLRGSDWGSAINPVTSTIYFIPFWVSQAMSVTKVFAQNSAVAQGSIDVGIYTEDGAYIISAGSTTHSGVNTPQAFDLSPDLIIGPGRFYLAVTMNTTQGTLLRASWTTTTFGVMAGMKYQFDTFPLPTTNVSFTNLTNTAAALPLRALPYVPMLGLTTHVTGP